MSSFHQIPNVLRPVSTEDSAGVGGPPWKEAGGLPQEPPALLSTDPFSVLTQPPRKRRLRDGTLQNRCERVWGSSHLAQ